MDKKLNLLAGKTAEAKFDSGAHFKLEYLSDGTMKWTDLIPERQGRSGIQAIDVVRLNDGLFTVSWVESTGTTVTHSINLNKGTVHGYRTTEDDKEFGGRAVATYDGTYKFITSDGKDDKTPFTNREITLAFWNGFFNEHDMSYADKYLAAPYTQHNPGVADGVEAFKNVFIPLFQNEYKEFTSEIVHVAVEDDLVYLHNIKKQTPSDRGSAGMDIFRVTDGKIIEHWDIIQPIPEKAANQHPMF